MTEQKERGFLVGSWERPDAAGVVVRGDAAGYVRGYAERYGEPPACFAGRRPGESCDGPAVMEVYGLTMCREHGEEAASGALAEIAHDLERELERPMNTEVGGLSPHLERALRHGFRSLPAEAYDHGREDAALLAAFPLRRELVDAETLNYAADPEAARKDPRLPPYDAFMSSRLLVCRHMRLAFEEEADWLVEMLEAERESVAAQAAYALALDREAGG